MGFARRCEVAILPHERTCQQANEREPREPREASFKRPIPKWASGNIGRADNAEAAPVEDMGVLVVLT